MNVKELVEFLKTQPQDLEVAYKCCSERNTLNADQITIQEACIAREDGWIHDKRLDKPFKTYLVFPGN